MNSLRHFWNSLPLLGVLYCVSIAGMATYGYIKPVPAINITVTTPVNAECDANEEAVVQLSSALFLLDMEVQRLKGVISTAKKLGMAL